MRPSGRQLTCTLVHPNDPDGHAHIIAMGLFAIAELLKRNGYPTTIIHTEIERLMGRDIVSSAHLNGETVLVGISCHWVSQVTASLSVARRIKELRPDAFVVLGGFTASFFAEQILEFCPSIDGVVRGDGEVPFLELARALDEQPGRARSLAQVPNLSWRRNGQLVRNPCSHVADEQVLDSLEFGDLDALRELSAYQGISGFLPCPGSSLDVSRVFYLCTGRGCPCSCTFCGGGRDAQIAINGRQGIAYRSAGRTVETIRRAIEYGYRTLYVSFDPDPSRKYYSELFERIRQQKLESSMIFGCWSLPTREFIDDFRRTFVDGVLEISPESASEAVRKRNRSFFFTNRDLEQTISYIGKNGLGCHLYFSYFHSQETATDVENTRRYYWDLLHRFGTFTDAYYLALSTDPASPVYFRPQEHAVEMEVSSFAGYLDIVRSGSVGNFRAHRPLTISPQQARSAEDSICADVFLKTTYKSSAHALLRMLGAPGFWAMLDEFYASYFDRGGRRDSLDALRQLASDFMNFVWTWLEPNGLGHHFTRDLVKYEWTLYEMRWAVRETGGVGSAHIESPDRAARDWSRASSASKPRSRGTVKVKTFDYDVHAIAAELSHSDRLPRPGWEPQTLLFHCHRGSLCITKINRTMAILLRCCDGSRTVEDVAGSIQQALEVAPNLRERVLVDTIDALNHLDEIGVLEEA